jgi:aminotransferase in exopolysaccharide biosynthesis
MIPLSVPSIRGNEWSYVKECLDTEWVSSAGKYVERFEADFSSYTGASHAVACVNGSAALHVALRVVGVQAGDEVIVPTLTFIATINAVKYLNAEPVFMDCDDYYNIDIEKTADFLKTQTLQRDGATFNQMTGRRISAAVPVHVFGNLVRMKELIGLCTEYNIRIVEDATESLGSFYLNKKGKGLHAGTLSDIGCFSFNGNKIITTGGGGMMVTHDSGLAAAARYLTTQAKDDDVRYVHNDVGYNYRLTNIQAAIGVAQLERLPEFVRIKQRNFLSYQEKIESIDGLTLAPSPPYALNNNWMYALQIDPDQFGEDRETLMARLTQKGVQTRPVWYLNHLQQPYRHCLSYHIEKANHLLERTLNIPCSVNLTEQDIAYVTDVLRHG